MALYAGAAVLAVVQAGLGGDSRLDENSEEQGCGEASRNHSFPRTGIRHGRFPSCWNDTPFLSLVYPEFQCFGRGSFRMMTVGRSERRRSGGWGLEAPSVPQGVNSILEFRSCCANHIWMTCCCFAPRRRFSIAGRASARLSALPGRRSSARTM